ncbi:MAG: DUF3868 domain-containing protein [Candidatus Symbiothrix sp.]|nr:DUF3868 domain-containing protein [Candidatus Symbiothrix sp.]
MKFKYSSILSILILLFGVSVFTSQSQGIMSVQKRQFKFFQGNVVIDFTVDIDGRTFSKNSQWILTPIIAEPSGKKMALPSLLVNGKTREKLYHRSLALNGVKKDKNIYGSLIIGNQSEHNIIEYQWSIPFEPWMKDASLTLLEDRCGCSLKLSLAELAESIGLGSAADKKREEVALAGELGDYQRLLAPYLELPVQAQWNYTYMPAVQFITPEKELVKKRDENGAAYLIFQVGKWDILPDLGNNKAELAKIDASVKYIVDEPQAHIQSMSIKAYASPEGAFESNLKLSENRAFALKNYIKQKYLIAGSIVSAEGMGEAWDDLRKLVEADTNIENKAEVLNIMRIEDIDAGRERKLMELSSGRPYNYMLENLFPLLRRVDYRFEYTIPPFTIKRGKELLKTKPVMLSVEEMYTIANTYAKGSPDFNKLFKTAVSVFPGNTVANLNAAAVAILENDYKIASDILKKYANEPSAWNNLALAYMHARLVNDAETYLQKAQQRGSIEAVQNRVALERMKVALAKYQEENADYELFTKIMNAQ